MLGGVINELADGATTEKFPPNPITQQPSGWTHGPRSTTSMGSPIRTDVQRQSFQTRPSLRSSTNVRFGSALTTPAFSVSRNSASNNQRIKAWSFSCRSKCSETRSVEFNLIHMVKWSTPSLVVFERSKDAPFPIAQHEVTITLPRKQPQASSCSKEIDLLCDPSQGTLLGGLLLRRAIECFVSRFVVGRPSRRKRRILSNMKPDGSLSMLPTDFQRFAEEHNCSPVANGHGQYTEVNTVVVHSAIAVTGARLSLDCTVATASVATSAASLAGSITLAAGFFHNLT